MRSARIKGAMKPTLSALAMLCCSSVFAEPDCVKTSEVCAAPNQTRNIDGVSFFRECWRWQSTYNCRSADVVNNCQPLRDRGCTQSGAACVDTAPDGSCSMYEQRYQCPLAPEKTVEKTVCDAAFCQDGDAGCFDTTRPPDLDFGQAAAIMEASREAGIYGLDPDKVEIFKGYMEECSLKVLGGASIKSCCSPSGGGGGFNNYAVIGLAAEAAYTIGKAKIKAGSKYVYDALFQAQDADLIQEGLVAAAGGLSEGAAEAVAAQAGTEFGAYGFEFSYSSTGGFQYAGFDPGSFAIAVAIAIVTEWLSCDQAEQVMAMKRGQSLCTHINTYCSRKTLGACTEKKERHCCFNSMLAKLINRQGRAQLGLAMNQCGGFTQVQLEALDFAQIDLSEFIASIAPKDLNADGLASTVGATVDQKVTDYYEH